ncbi:MAG: MCE family protein [Burkholderiales bacterium]|nr:MCE family protein [Burkholderiales bacterium]
MSAKANYFKLGLFILAGLAVTVAMVLALGAGRLFGRSILLETYVDDSIQGLDVGSKVRYRGVLLGEVTRLGFTAERYELDKPLGQRKNYVLVEARLDAKDLGPLGKADAEVMQQYIDQGLRIRVAPQGITGINYLELDFTDPTQNPPLPIDWQPRNLYVPSARAKLTQVANQVESVLRSLDEADLARLARDASTLLEKTAKKVDALPVEKLGAEGTALLAELRDTNRKLAALLGGADTRATFTETAAAAARLRQILGNPALDTLPNDVAAAAASVRATAESERLKATIASLDRIASRLDNALAGSGQDIAATLENLRQITENLRDLSESARRYPAGALFGEPPPPIRRSPQ